VNGGRGYSGGQGGASPGDMIVVLVMVLAALSGASGWWHQHHAEFFDRAGHWKDRAVAALPFTDNGGAWAPPGAVDSLHALDGLPVEPAGPIRGYSRTRLFPGWGDVDGDGCNTRTEVLERDLTDTTVVDRETKAGKRQCQVIFGTLSDPYSGRTVSYSIQTVPSPVQIDHVVPLGEAWKSGAAGWPLTRWREFANDERNLLAVSAHENESKGDDDPSRYLPPNTAYRCAYGERYVAVKADYGLAVDAAERTRLTALLKGC
jgi:hypothetical protein